MSVDIPDEAWAAIRNGSYCSEAGAVELAAPHIAWAAQVATLREWTVRLNSAMLELDPIPQQVYAVYRDAMLDLAELEAGAGQTGEGNEQV